VSFGELVGNDPNMAETIGIPDERMVGGQDALSREVDRGSLLT
jgi:hypothetical protein